MKVGNGHHVHTANDGRASVTLVFRRSGRHRVTATEAEYRRGHAVVRVP